MSPKVFGEYRRIFRSLHSDIRTALEVGAVPTCSALLTSDELAHVPLKIGINLREFGAYRDVLVVPNDARRIAFRDNSFDLVVSSSTLEHVPEFWEVCHEMKRVLAPGGCLIVNVPGFVETPIGNRIRRLAFRLRLPDSVKRATPTFRVHEAPNDYYRFSVHCLRDVILRDLVTVKIWHMMNPPRIFGLARKPG